MCLSSLPKLTYRSLDLPSFLSFKDSFLRCILLVSITYVVQSLT